MKNIITTDKRDFLKNERPWFPSMTNKEFKQGMYDDVISCDKCGIWYWKDCKKRCSCTTN